MRIAVTPGSHAYRAIIPILFGEIMEPRVISPKADCAMFDSVPFEDEPAVENVQKLLRGLHVCDQVDRLTEEDRGVIRLFEAVSFLRVFVKPNPGPVPVRIQAAAYRQLLQGNAARLDTVKALSLAKSRLTTVPRELRLLRNVRDLDLSYNAIESLHIDAAALKRLNLSHNALKDLCLEAPALERLDLAHNPDLQGTNLYVPNLCRLDLSGTPIFTLQRASPSLPRLQRIVLYDNQAEEICRWIPQLPNIQFVDFQRNPEPKTHH